MRQYKQRNSSTEGLRDFHQRKHARQKWRWGSTSRRSSALQRPLSQLSCGIRRSGGHGGAPAGGSGNPGCSRTWRKPARGITVQLIKKRLGIDSPVPLTAGLIVEGIAPAEMK